jgi:hypothetical protein
LLQIPYKPEDRSFRIVLWEPALFLHSEHSSISGVI